MIIEIEVTAMQYSAMQYIALDVEDWASNALTARASSAIDEIVALVVKKCLEGGTQIPSSKEDMVALAYSSGWVKTVEQTNTEPTIDTLK